MVWALPAWTLFVWATRIRIISTQGASWTDVIVPVVLTVLAVVALLDRRRGTLALVAATVVVWAIRLPFVFVHHHSAPFKAVHTVLAVVSFGLAYGAWRAVTRRRALAAR